MNTRLILVMTAWSVFALPAQTSGAAEDAFPDIIYTLTGSYPEGFAIGMGTTAYNGSPLGSIYKFDLRTGQGDVLVPVQNPDPFTACVALGMRVDLRTNYLFVAGCFHGNAFVYDADSGALLMEYQLGPPGSLVNDLAITKDAVYFTDSLRPVLYRLPLFANGQIPLAPDAAIEVPLGGDFETDPSGECCNANGIVATPNGKTLIVGHSNFAQLYRVNPNTGHADAIDIDPPLAGFLDGIAMQGRTLYILTPGFPPDVDGIQVVKLKKDLLSGKAGRAITNPNLDGVASGAIFGNSLYVNNARYLTFPEPDTEYWVTKLKIRSSPHKGD